jgi:hypothetical protein
MAQSNCAKLIAMNGSLHGYLRKCQAKFDRSEQKKIDGVMIYFWWNVWN